MNIQLMAFGIAKDIIKGSALEMEVAVGTTVGELKTKLCEQYPDFELLRSFSIAVNEEYRKDNFELSARDEIVIIPPVSGG